MVQEKDTAETGMMMTEEITTEIKTIIAEKEEITMNTEPNTEVQVIMEMITEEAVKKEMTEETETVAETETGTDVEMAAITATEEEDNIYR